MLPTSAISLNFISLISLLNLYLLIELSPISITLIKTRLTYINKINPKYSIISVGKNNKFGHPNNNVLDNLKKSKIYRTDIDGSIKFKIKNNKLKIETCVT